MNSAYEVRASRSALRSDLGTDERLAHGICVDAPDPELWFADPGSVEAREAQRICGNCPVMSDCLFRAVDTNEKFGVWGGVHRNAKKRTGTA